MSLGRAQPILACLLAVELVAIRKKPLVEILRELYRETGRFFNGRCNFCLDRKGRAGFVRRIEALSRRKSLCGRRLSKFNGLDGYKFIFADGSWLMFRASGTEPVVRCYCEAASKAGLKDLLGLGRRLI